MEICDILRSQLGHDFSGYRDKTFLRRVQRRMQVVNVATMHEYVLRLRDDHEEGIALFRDLLIRVTSFFRDSGTFETLEQTVIPLLFDGKGADAAVRVWVPGCATGEEAYSLAMLLREHMDTVAGAPKVHVFATDIDEAAIDTARLGRYPSTLLEGLSPERRARFFRASQGGFVVTKDIRELCTFSPHNLLRDPPFSRMNLVSCRNLLIYLDANVQAAVIPVFHYSLVPQGVLLLGGSESVSKHTDLFDPLDKHSRIFQKRDVRSPALHLTGQNFDLHAFGRAEKAGYRSSGLASSNNPGHPGSLSEHRRFNKAVAVRPQDKTTPSFMSFWKRIFPLKVGMQRLQSDLDNAQEALHSLAEEHQTALEELRSANEELHSVNEEMQSTNEELETSKEELQSVNEELNTVNVRLSEKVDELDAANSDLRNLFVSTEIATIFLDRHLIIRSFTPAIASLYNLIPSDQGRPLSDIVTRLRYDGLRDDVAQVLSTLEPLERQISRDDRASHYIMRVLPYREPDSTVSGVLVTFVDVTSIIQAEETLREADLRKDVFLATLSHELRNPLAPIRSATRLLEFPDLAMDDRNRAQAIISRQVNHLTSLLDDLLDVSRISRGAVMLKKEYVSLQAVLSSAIEAVQPMLEAKQHTLTTTFHHDAITVEADPVRLTQVISNLLGNAVKYTPTGGRILVDSALNENELRITVRDNGIGLAPEMITQVFQMFARGEAIIDRAQEGLGIGLALAKGLVELHDGRIEAKSAGLGRGSEFTIVLPRSIVVPTPPVHAEELEPNSPDQQRMLVADDNVDGAESLRLLLTLIGHDVVVAHDGEAALQMANRVRPTVAVLDIGMPGLNGYEVARRIRREAWGGQMTLIALTGWGQENDKNRAREAGFDHHLTKPITLEQLRKLLPVTGRSTAGK